MNNNTTIQSPFADFQQLPVGLTQNETSDVGVSFESPFTTAPMNFFSAENELHDHQQFFMDHLYDSSFDNLLQGMVAETMDMLPQSQLVNNFVNDPRSDVQFVNQNFAQFLETSDKMFNNMIEAANASDGKLTNLQLEQLFDQFAPRSTGLSDIQEQFLGKLFNKAKKAISQAGNAIKKGVSSLGKFLPINTILEKIKALVRPLLARVLKFAINKIPQSLRPIAIQLAEKLFGKNYAQGEVSGERTLPTYGRPAFTANDAQVIGRYPATQDVGVIQRELDQQLSAIALHPNEQELDFMISEYSREVLAPEQNILANFHSAKEKFINEISKMEEGENPTPVIQEFIPAIIPLLKMGVSIIGRKKIVDFLAKYLSQMISGYIGVQPAQMLASTIIDSGLGMIGLETSVATDPKKLAAGVLANTVVDTLTNVSNYPEYILDDSHDMPHAVNHAFENAAKNNFPSQLLREEIQDQVGVSTGSFLKASKFYNKYSELPVIDLTLAQADQIKTFNNTSVGNHLRSELGITAGGATVKARLHIYQAVPGTWLSRISINEKVPGLNSAHPAAWSKIHPLTPEAAAILGHAHLGKAVDPRFLSNRNMIDVGQHFFYLEIIGGQSKNPTRRKKTVITNPTTPPNTPKYPDTFKLRTKILSREIGFKLYLNDASIQMILDEAGNGKRMVAISYLSRILHAEKQYDVQLEVTEEFAPLVAAAAAIGKDVLKDTFKSALKWLTKFFYDWAQYEITILIRDHLSKLKTEMDKSDEGVTISVTGTIGIDLKKIILLASPITGFQALNITSQTEIKAGYHL